MADDTKNIGPESTRSDRTNAFMATGHTVKHKAVEQLCICGQIFELLSGHKQPGDAVMQ